MSQQKQNKERSDLMRYAGLATQIFVSLGIAVYLGYRIDKWVHFKIPLLVWLLPFIVLGIMMYQLMKETSKKDPS